MLLFVCLPNFTTGTISRKPTLNVTSHFRATGWSKSLCAHVRITSIGSRKLFKCPCTHKCPTRSTNLCYTYSDFWITYRFLKEHRDLVSQTLCNRPCCWVARNKIQIPYINIPHGLFRDRHLGVTSMKTLNGKDIGMKSSCTRCLFTWKWKLYDEHKTRMFVRLHYHLCLISFWRKQNSATSLISI